jgi:Winged helix-turn helix
VEQALLKGAGANGFVGELWTLDRIATVVERLTGVRHHPAWVGALLRHRLGWSVQRPVRRAAERDQAAIHRWVKEDWPRIKQTVSVVEAVGEDCRQALALAPRYDSLCNWHPGGLPSGLSCLRWCRRRPGPPRWPDQQPVQPCSGL